MTRDQYLEECLRRNPTARRWIAYVQHIHQRASKAPKDRPTLRPIDAELWAEMRALDWSQFTRRAEGFVKPGPTRRQDRIILSVRRAATKREILAAWKDACRDLGWNHRTRTHSAELTFRLQVYHVYHELRNFTQVAQRLAASEANVRRAYEKVFRDIHGVRRPRRTKEGRAAGFDSRDHMQSCRTCQKAKTVEGMCSAGRAFVEVDTRASVGAQTEKGTPEIENLKKKGRKPVAD